MFDSMMFDPSENSILMIEPPGTENYKKEFVEHLFEKENCSGLLFKNNASLSAFLHSKEHAIVIDIGGHNTFISTVSEGDVVAQGLVISFDSSKIWRGSFGRRNSESYR